MGAAGPAVIAGYQLDGVIGRGCASEVWRAHRLVGEPAAPVAIKRARRPELAASAARMQAEAAILAELDLPNIVHVLDVVPDVGGIAIVMDLAPSGSLEGLLAERGALPAGQVVAIVAPLALALGAAHRRSVLHGDVKPANVLFSVDGEPLLSDFGVARPLAPGSADGGPVAGSAAYIDPHLLATGRPDPRNDVYSLGVLTYLALTGRLPHAGEDDDEILDAAARGAHPSLIDHPAVPPLLAAAVEAALAVDPDDRPPTAEYFAASVRAAVDADEVVLPHGDGPAWIEPARSDQIRVGSDTRTFGPRPVRPAPEPAGRDRRAAMLRVAAVIAAVGLVGVFALVVRDRARQEVEPGAAVLLHAPSKGACPQLERIPVPTAGRELSADLAGDGCPVQVVWDGTIMQFRLDSADTAPRRYDFTRVGASPRSGELLVGDWDCDGTESPAFYDPINGEVHYFGAIPGTGELPAGETDLTGVERGRPRVVRERGGGSACDRVEVLP